jgi:heparan-alpha-glucosaminide N-acetyltransferase
LYARPTCQKIYQTTMPFDPEGILGIFNSIVLTYLGAQAGKIILYHKSDYTRLILWFIWGLITFSLFGILTFFDLENGPIPVNKNLWTLTFTLITGCSSYFIILILYFVIDIKKWWDGSPIIYPGMNSIVIYFFHLVFRTTFPSQWMVSNTHVAQLFLNIWGSFFWTGVATYLYYKKIFINL